MKNIFIIIFALIVMSACEDFEDPIAGIPETDLFVQFGANTPDTVAAGEGGTSQTVTIQSPISFQEDLIATITFTGSAEFGVDFDISADSITSGNSGTKVYPIVSKDANGASILVPYIPAGGNDLITDQVDFDIDFLSDGITDGDKVLEVALTGATGTTTSSLTLAGGRGPIRNDTYINIADSDCPANPSEMEGAYTTTESCGGDFTFTSNMINASGNQITIDNFGGWGAAGTNQLVLTINPADNSITFDDTEINGAASGFGVPAEEPWLARGSGKVNLTCTDAPEVDITFSYVRQSDDQVRVGDCTHNYSPE
ncbi:hypothetical protein [Marinoscillum furvescens]|uniref:Calx-beta domain-containing protein n=1 Tax=Marinoscillum furvescens DSM 4134 TaxID=1122208 RepID=A0A3D9KYD9_MARFU|nr:hypothetical protein [Marinoscillum furvescens]RED92626.1 hypothetical protein C7460_12913 [Marinoscillum furvescens DSM 4134]